jgi:hypothetical protein
LAEGDAGVVVGDQTPVAHGDTGLKNIVGPPGGALDVIVSIKDGSCVTGLNERLFIATEGGRVGRSVHARIWLSFSSLFRDFHWLQMQ